MKKSLADQILVTALALAEDSSWEEMHLYDIAGQLEISLDEIRKVYPQKDALAEAWFDCADRAVLNIEPSADFLKLSQTERVQQVIMTWLEALAMHRDITREMLSYKFECGHIHLQTLGIMRISRTVQWFREAARTDTTGLRRIIEEIAMTSIYLATFASWLRDDSSNSKKTRDFLSKALSGVEHCPSTRLFSQSE